MVYNIQKTNILFKLAIYWITTEKCTSNFTRYEYYPQYCSTPNQMLQRKIPPMRSCNDKCQLAHVITVIRHGSRAPNEMENCWEGYQSPSSDTATWNCNLSTVAATPKFRNNMLRKNTNTENSILFNKKYDEGEDPYEHLKLNGTCRKGDLLDEAYAQEFANGEILRDAYVTTNFHQMMLFDRINPDDLHLQPWTYFRSDDIPRTIMSGQILLQGLFQNAGEISVHTAFHKNDILEPADKHCPKLKTLIEKAESSAEYQLGIHSHEAKSLKKLYEKKLQGRAPDLMDCLMTTICSDRTLPELLDDFDGDEDGESNFIKLANFETWKNNYLMDYNNAAYSKVSSGPLWSDILSKINNTLSVSSIESLNSNRNRFLLYSAHDSTISTLLASLGKDTAMDHLSWPPYASMLNIEIYANSVNERDISKFSFRIVYNGDILTQIVEGCPKTEELCDFDVLLRNVNSFAGAKDDLCAEDGFTS